MDLARADGVQLRYFLPEDTENVETGVRLRGVEYPVTWVLLGEGVPNAPVLCPDLLLAIEVEGRPEASGRV